MKASKTNSRSVALVTGGASFLGAAISRKLVMEGFRVVLHYQSSKTKSEKLAREINSMGEEAVVLKADLSKVEQAEGLVQSVTRRFKRLDLLVNNASLFDPTPFPLASPAKWQKTFSVNLFSPYFLCQTAAPWLRKSKGSVINLTDIYAEHPLLKGYPAYCASKAGLLCVTKMLARELGPDVRVNAVSPGAIFIPKTYSRKQREDLIRRSALKRQGTPEEIADAVHFLANHKFITGQVLNVDGGRFF
jgi:pteridine reductase